MSNQNLNSKVDLENQLMSACRIGDLEKVKELAKLGADVHVKDESALRLAASNGHSEIVKYLVKEEIDIHIWNDWPLRLSSLCGHLKIVKYLVEECKANVHVLDESALKWAVKDKKFKMISCLLNYYNSKTLTEELKDELKDLLNINSRISFKELKKRIAIEVERQELINV